MYGNSEMSKEKKTKNIVSLAKIVINTKFLK